MIFEFEIHFDFFKYQILLIPFKISSLVFVNMSERDYLNEKIILFFRIRLTF